MHRILIDAPGVLERWLTHLWREARGEPPLLYCAQPFRCRRSPLLDLTGVNAVQDHREGTDLLLGDLERLEALRGMPCESYLRRTPDPGADRRCAGATAVNDLLVLGIVWVPWAWSSAGTPTTT
jgi:hypothetical protein